MRSWWLSNNSGSRRVAWLARAAACVMAGGLLGGCSTPWNKGACDNCVPPKSLACYYHHCWDKLVTLDTAHECALKDLKHAGKTSHHFKGGFVRAYEDLALGRYAAVPPVPPSKYWTAYYRSCAGQPAVADWYEGYRTGLEVGMQSGVSRFNRVPSSGNGQCGPFANDFAGDGPYPDYAPPANGMMLGGRYSASQNTVTPVQYSEHAAPRSANW